MNDYENLIISRERVYMAVTCVEACVRACLESLPKDSRQTFLFGMEGKIADINAEILQEETEKDAQ